MKISSNLETEIMSHQATREAIDSLADLFDHECETSGLTKSQFAERIGRDPSYVSRILNGRAANFTFLSLSRMFVALGYWPEVKARPIGDNAVKCNFMPEHIESPKITYRHDERAATSDTLTRNMPTVKIRVSPTILSEVG